MAQTNDQCLAFSKRAMLDQLMTFGPVIGHLWPLESEMTRFALDNGHLCPLALKSGAYKGRNEFLQPSMSFRN
ncbi:hypothetical protein D3C78_1238730 [compost metagenome]